MATISTTTSGIAIDYPSHAGMARDDTNGYLYFFARSDNTTGYRVWRSIDGGASWSTFASFARANVFEWSSIVVDRAKWLHVAYRVSDATTDRLFYRRLNLNTGAWSNELQVSGTNGSGDANGGAGGSFWQGCDIAVVRHADGAYAIAVVGSNTYSGSKYGVIVHGVSIDNAGNVYSNNGLITNTRSFQTSGTPTGGTRPVCELEHNGDGQTSTTPHLWIAWGRNQLYQVKLSWQGPSVGWQGPSSFQTIDSSIPGVDYIAGRWDGVRWMMVVIDSDDASVVDVYERNQANTLTTVRTTPQHPQGVVRTLAISYDASSKNPRIFAVGTANSTLYAVDFVRATLTWGTWIQVSTDTIQASPPDEYTTRRGGTTGNARYDLAYTTGASSPYTLKNVQQLAQYAPSTPTWDTSVTPYTAGGAADVAAVLLLDWTFVDIDPADTQIAYALRRQIGAGAFAYWNATTVTWGVSEVFNTSGTTAVTLAAAWGLDADGTHQYAVKVRDTGSLDSGYSAALSIVPSAKVNPTVTAPAAAAVLATNYVTVTWTVAEQTQYRVQLSTSGGLQVTDTGWRVGTDLTYTVPYALGDGTAWTVALTTKNNEGLASTTQTRAFTVDYTEPPSATLVVTPVTASGIMQVTVTNPSPVGTQPALLYVDLYRRLGELATLNANPKFTGNVTSWAGTGTTTFTYSTTQAHEGTGSARLVPTGAAASSYAESAQIVIDATRTFFAGAWVRPDTANKPIVLTINWYTTGGAFISGTSRTVTPPIAATWQYLSVTGVPVATTAKATVAVGLGSTPAVGDAAYVDEVVLQVLNTDAGTPVASTLGAGATVNDWQVPARTPVEYQAIAYGANGTQIASPWTA